MPIPKVKQHTYKIQLVNTFFKINHILKEYYSNNIKKYFDLFELKYKKAYFQELEDFPLYYYRG